MIRIDDPGIELTYLWLVIMAWTWALSQAREAWRQRHAWPTTTALWMFAKAAYFTFVGSVWWFDWFDPFWHAVMISVLAIAHTIAFAHWLILPRSDDEERPSAPPDRREPA